MRLRSLVAIALLALVLPAATVGAAKPKFVRVVKRQGAFTAVLTYTNHPKDWISPISNVRLRIERDGRVVLRRKICQPELRRPYRCDSWGQPADMVVARVGPSNTRAFLVNLWTGGNTCCQATFAAILGPRVAWITHTFSFLGARTQRIRGHTFFIGSDGRFYCSFSVCAGGSTPIQIWTIDAADYFVDVTRRFPALIRAHAHRVATGGGRHSTIEKQGSGVLAAWCGDEYLLGKGRRCARVLAYAVRHHQPNMQGAEPTRRFVRALNRYLARWGYKRR